MIGDPIWQVTPCSSVMGFPLRAIRGFNLFYKGLRRIDTERRYGPGWLRDDDDDDDDDDNLVVSTSHVE